MDWDPALGAGTPGGHAIALLLGEQAFDNDVSLVGAGGDPTRLAWGAGAKRVYPAAP
jgi:hypothetical protein